MKKFIAITFIVMCLMKGTLIAQIKIAYVRIDDIVGVMPELAPGKVNMDTIGAQYITDSIMPGLNYKQTEYNEKVAAYSDTTKKYSPQVKTQMLKEINDLQQELSGADAFIQQVTQSKQTEFLRPFYVKAKKAIEQVAKEKGYTHVMSTDVFLVAPETDDISLLVLSKLGIKPPNTNLPGTNKPAIPAKPNN